MYVAHNIPLASQPTKPETSTADKSLGDATSTSEPDVVRGRRCSLRLLERMAADGPAIEPGTSAKCTVPRTLLVLRDKVPCVALPTAPGIRAAGGPIACCVHALATSLRYWAN